MWRILISISLVSLVAAQSLRFQPHDSATVNNIICPDKQGTCPDETTCCLLTSGKYGCCPMPQATCCSDHLHCCPRGYKCNMELMSCSQGNKTLAMVLKQAANPVTKANDVVCPGGQSQCPGVSTCCKLLSGKWGCCPLPKATCCQDGTHCCPAGYQCNTATSSCQKAGNSNSWFMLKPAGVTQTKSGASTKKISFPSGRQMVKPVSHKKKLCPGGQTFCDGGKTCCFKDKWHFTCCPFINGVCCHGAEHCCPLGFSCDMKLGKCTKGEEIVLPWGHTHESKTAHEPEPEDSQIEVDEGTVSCPDGKSSCPDGSTCCLLLSGKYGCCPLEQAVCCSDHLHCCPHGSVCDVEAQTCQQGIETIPWSEKSPAIPTTSNSDDLVGGDTIVCPGGQATCPDGSTCCLLESGQYGCCPLQEAVCCADHLHCCPKGTTCDPKSETCNKGSYNIPWSMKFPAEPRMHKANNECSDNKTSCSESTTCCLMLDGYYACCPFENAKCCPDKLHCCPSNQVCDVTKGECVNPKGVSMSMLEKLPSTPDLANIVCPDEKTCPAGSTCCQISVGLFGCCPMEKAVCCSDHVHCCPEGYTCDVTTAKCTSHGLTVPWVAKSPSRPMTNEGSSPLKNVICPDKVSFCPDQTTCCMLSTQQYGCCPLPNAACCKDGVHCCPSGYKCDTVKGTCDKAALSIPWAEKFAAEPVTVSAGWVVCPDKASQCQDGETCCKQATGQYGCCPLPKAVCCSDGAHCCPEGSTCDVAKGTCSSTSNSLVISWSMIRRTTPVLLTDTPQNVEPVTCPDKTTCPQGSTCCMMKSGAYGCCPYSEGSCCSDQVHCCPKGFHCDKTGRSCETIDSSLSLTSTMFTRFKTQPTQDNTLTVQIVKCPGGKEQCPDGSTCCKQPSGQFGCCKFDNAVCCSDGVHCCPQGFACDPQSGTCTQAVPWTTKLPATPIPPAESELGEMLVESDMPFSAVVCPDRQHQCPDGSTCCKLDTGVWGCCAFPQAVCCDDGVHCCPRGYTCLVQQGQCVTQTHATSLAFIAMASSTSDTYN